MTAMRRCRRPRLASHQGKLETLYMDWQQAGQQCNGGNRNLLIALGWSRGLSSETTEARGPTRVDRLGGEVRVEIDGMDPAQEWDVWLVDNQEGPQRSSLSEGGDLMHKLGRLRGESGRAVLSVHFDRSL